MVRVTWAWILTGDAALVAYLRHLDATGDFRFVVRVLDDTHILVADSRKQGAAGAPTANAVQTKKKKKKKKTTTTTTTPPADLRQWLKDRIDEWHDKHVLSTIV